MRAISHTLLTHIVEVNSVVAYRVVIIDGVVVSVAVGRCWYIGAFGQKERAVKRLLHSPHFIYGHSYPHICFCLIVAMSLFYSSISSWCYIHSFFSSCYVYFSIWDYSFCLTATLLNFYPYHLSTFLAHVNSPCLVWSFAVVIFIDLYITYVDIVMRTKYFLNPLNHRYCFSLQ